MSPGSSIMAFTSNIVNFMSLECGLGYADSDCTACVTSGLWDAQYTNPDYGQFTITLGFTGEKCSHIYGIVFLKIISCDNLVIQLIQNCSSSKHITVKNKSGKFSRFLKVVRLGSMFTI